MQINSQIEAKIDVFMNHLNKIASIGIDSLNWEDLIIYVDKIQEFNKDLDIALVEQWEDQNER